MSSPTATIGARTRIDPRMRARRIAVQRREGRRRLRRLVALLVVATLLGLAYLATRSPLLDVDGVRVDGTSHTDPSALLEAAGIRRGEPMTGVDVGRARAAVAALPWIDHVEVSRHWPGSIEIHVTERTPTAAVRTSTGEWLVVDATGRVLERETTAPADVPHAAVDDEGVAPGLTQPGLSGTVAVASLLTPDLRAWVVSIDPMAGGTVELALKGDIRVRLGSQAHLADKIVDLATVLTRVDLTGLDTIDLQVPHTPVLTRKPPAA